MADLSKVIIFLVLHWTFGVKKVSCHFCESFVCSSKEYCCGNNKCCPNPDPNAIFYTVAWVILGLMILILLYGLSRYKKYFFRMCSRHSEDKVLLATA